MIISSAMIASIIGSFLANHAITKTIQTIKPIAKEIGEDAIKSTASDFVKDHTIGIVSDFFNNKELKNKLCGYIAKACKDVLLSYKGDSYIQTIDPNFDNSLNGISKYLIKNQETLFVFDEIEHYEVGVNAFSDDVQLEDFFSKIGLEYNVAQFFLKTDFVNRWINKIADYIALDEEMYRLIVLKNINSISGKMDLMDYIFFATKSIDSSIKNYLKTKSVQETQALTIYNRYLHAKYNKQDQICGKGIINLDVFDLYYQQTVNRKVGVFYRNYLPEYVLPEDIESRKSDLNKEIEYMDYMPIETMFHFYDDVFLFSESGYGKTTFVSYFISLITGIYLDKKKYVLRNSDYISSLSEYLIIPFSCTEFEKNSGVCADYSMLLQSYAQKYNIQDLLNVYLKSGNLLLIFDDFNRLTDKNTRNSFCRAIRDFKEVYPGSKCLILSGDKSTELHDQYLPNFENISINPLSSLDLEAYVVNYCKLFGIKPNMQAQLLGELNTWDSRYAMIIENPKYVSLIINLYINGDIKLMDVASIYHQICRELVLNMTDSLFPEYSLRKTGRIIDEFELILSELAFAHLYENRTVFDYDYVADRIDYYFEENSKLIIDYLIQNKYCILQYTRQNFYFTHACRFAIEYYASKRLVGKPDFISEGTDICKSSYELWKSSFCLSMLTSGVDIGTSAVRSVLYNLSSDNYLNEIRMAAQALCMFDKEILQKRGERKEVLLRCKDELKKILNLHNISPIEKNEFAQYLSQLGDDRDGVSDCVPTLIFIEKGSVVLGGDNITFAEKYIYEMDYDYYISKYPITNAQYEYFLKSRPDYPLPTDPNHIWDLKTRSIDRRFSNHPVVGVNFLDALEYCKWLNDVMQTTGIYNSEYNIMLPSDAEWLKAYRGSIITNNDPDGQYAPLYPWGDEWKDNYANTPINGSGAYSTTAVGVYENNVSKYGIFDMCGNVLEWTSTIWGNEISSSLFGARYNPNDGREEISNCSLMRIARGGSWLFAEGVAKCSCRLNPDQKFPDTGFRIVYKPIMKSK